MKHLRVFAIESDYTIASLDTPCVSYVEATGNVHYDVPQTNPYSGKALSSSPTLPTLIGDTNNRITITCDDSGDTIVNNTSIGTITVRNKNTNVQTTLSINVNMVGSSVGASAGTDSALNFTFDGLHASGTSFYLYTTVTGIVNMYYLDAIYLTW